MVEDAQSNSGKGLLAVTFIQRLWIWGVLKLEDRRAMTGREHTISLCTVVDSSRFLSSQLPSPRRPSAQFLPLEAGVLRTIDY